MSLFSAMSINDIHVDAVISMDKDNVSILESYAKHIFLNKVSTRTQIEEVHGPILALDHDYVSSYYAATHKSWLDKCLYYLMMSSPI